MTWLDLYPEQLAAVNKLKNGNVLCGGTGSGKSRTSLAYYYKTQGGDILSESYVRMKSPKDLYIITTAKKRNTGEWHDEMIPFLLYPDEDDKSFGYKNKVIVDSWNNIGKYEDAHDAFFIFDEQHIVGNGAWVKSFLRIAKNNNWILLTATPGDKWIEYVPVFIANGFYRNRSEFIREHVIYKRFSKIPGQIDRYVNERKLCRLRDLILVDIPIERMTVQNHIDVFCDFDVRMYKDTVRNRWDPFKNKPIESASDYCYVLRKIVNSADSRCLALLELSEFTPRIIVFYNFDYELEILKSLYFGDDVVVAEYNGHKHQPVPTSEKWVYLVQYTSGCEAWNCITTDTIVYYSQNYSYKVIQQANGRIDRLNTKYKDLFYYHFKSKASIDLAINRAYKEKKKFNEGRFVKKFS